MGDSCLVVLAYLGHYFLSALLGSSSQCWCLLGPHPECYGLHSFGTTFLLGRGFFGEALHGNGESLNLSLEGGRAWFVSLSVVGGCHRASEHHATLCSGGDSMAYKSQFPTDSAN